MNTPNQDSKDTRIPDFDVPTGKGVEEILAEALKGYAETCNAVLAFLEKDGLGFVLRAYQLLLSYKASKEKQELRDLNDKSNERWLAWSEKELAARIKAFKTIKETGASDDAALQLVFSVFPEVPDEEDTFTTTLLDQVTKLLAQEVVKKSSASPCFRGPTTIDPNSVNLADFEGLNDFFKRSARSGVDVEADVEAKDDDVDSDKSNPNWIPLCATCGSNQPPLGPGFGGAKFCPVCRQAR